MNDEMRKEFEAYMGAPDVIISKVGGEYVAESTKRDFKIWQAAYQLQQKRIDEQAETIRCMSKVFDDLAGELNLPASDYGEPDALFDAIDELKALTGTKS